MPVPAAFPVADPAQFLRVVAQGAALDSHQALWRWLRGEAQALLPHQLLLAAWGDFRSGALRFDLVSSLPGLRTREAGALPLAPLATLLRDCWAAAHYQPCRVELEPQARPAALAALPCALVHGLCEAGPGGERIVAVLGPRRASDAEAFALRVLLPFIDAALRRLADPGPRAPPALAALAPLDPPAALSARERQVMGWVALGKTNPEIGCILRISEFTVKNHMKSIFSKLDVSNRAQAVAKLTRLVAHAG